MKRKQLTEHNYENFEEIVESLALNYFSQKSSTIDIWHGSKYASELLC